MKAPLTSIFLLGSLLLAACDKETSDSIREPQPIQLAYYLQDGDKITNVTRAITADINKTGVSLYCVYHKNNFENKNAATPYPQLFWNTPIDEEGRGADGAFRYWLGSKDLKYTFWAHTTNPKGVTESGVIDVSGGRADHQSPVIGFKQSDEPLKQIDLLVADQVSNLMVSYMPPLVGLFFKHFLSKVSIRFYNSHGTQLNNCKATITYGGNDIPSQQVLRGFYANIGGMYLNTNGMTYGGHSGTYPLHEGSFIVSANTTLPSYSYLAGDLMLTPQKVNDGFISVSLTYTAEGKTNATTAVVDIPAPPIVKVEVNKGSQHSSGNDPYYGETNTYLQIGYAYTYHINVIEESTSLKIGAVTLSNWEGQNSEVVNWEEYK